MQCMACNETISRNVWKCPRCGRDMLGGVVFVTGITGSGIGDKLKDVVSEATAHSHCIQMHDVGEIMKKHALTQEPGVRWDRILDAPDRLLGLLRALAFEEIYHEVKSKPDVLHLIDLHLTFRWRTYLTKGFQPHILQRFIPRVRCFINVIEDLPKIQEQLRKMAWGNRNILELLIWRDEELLLADMFADICGRVPSFAVAKGEPASIIEQLIWHPEMKKVYLSFPITALVDDEEAQMEIRQFRDKLREFLVVFDPYACRDYDETYKMPEMTMLRGEVGEVVVDRDFRFINQADAVVVYYPKKVPSKGVDSEMRHARDTGKDIFLYCPEELNWGPFQPPADHIHLDRNQLLDALKTHLAPAKQCS